MFGNRKEKRSFVVMDGSDPRFMKEVVGTAEMMTGKTHWFNKIRPRKLDKQHPTMKVITIKCGYEEFDRLRLLLTEQYLEQCIFGVVL